MEIILNKKSEIRIHIELDKNKMPEKIEWQADDADFKGVKESKTIFLALWDKAENVTLGIDLWTKEMLVDEMNLHYYQMILKLGDTYRKATQNVDVANMIDDFASEFSDKLKLFSKK